jgi:hypothetical protein
MNLMCTNLIYVIVCLSCVDCVLTSPRITLYDPGRQTPHDEVVLSQLVIRARLGQHTKHIKITAMLSVRITLPI